MPLFPLFVLYFTFNGRTTTLRVANTDKNITLFAFWFYGANFTTPSLASNEICWNGTPP